MHDTAWWIWFSKTLYIDYGKVYEIADLTVSVDHNDNYSIEYSEDNESWSPLAYISKNIGDINWGTDIFSTKEGHPEYEPSIDFASPKMARFVRIRGSGGDGYYSIGEVQVESVDEVESVDKEKTVIDVLVVPTAEAIAWAAEKKISCKEIVDGINDDKFSWEKTEEEKDRSNIIKYYTDVEIPDIKIYIAQLNEFFGLKHVCQEDPNLADPPSETLESEEKALLYTHNLIQISLAEATQIYQNSGIENVEFRLVGWHSSDQGSTIGSYPSLPLVPGNDIIVDYESFKEPSPWHRNPIINTAANINIPNVPQGVYEEVYSLRNLDYKGTSEIEKSLDKVHVYRKAAEADIVILLTTAAYINAVDSTDGAITGQGLGIGVLSADNAFAWVSVEQAVVPYYAMAHEISHLLGAGHYDTGKVIPILGYANLLAGMPDYVTNSQSPGDLTLDNQGFIGQFTLEDDQFYYGTLMSKVFDCADYNKQEKPISGQSSSP